MTPCADREIIEISTIRSFFELLGLEKIELVALTVCDISSWSPWFCPEVCSEVSPIGSVAAALARCAGFSLTKGSASPLQSGER
jgi:hypothetical protein